MSLDSRRVGSGILENGYDESGHWTSLRFITKIYNKMITKEQEEKYKKNGEMVL